MSDVLFGKYNSPIIPAKKPNNAKSYHSKMHPNTLPILFFI
jgi:hypothetical protein